jgi:hypothetical protein
MRAYDGQFPADVELDIENAGFPRACVACKFSGRLAERKPDLKNNGYRNSRQPVKGMYPFLGLLNITANQTLYAFLQLPHENTGPSVLRGAG